MTAFLYTIGAAFLAMALLTTEPKIALVLAVFYLSSDLMVTLTGRFESSIWQYSYFALVCAAVGIFLTAQGNALLLVAGLACFVSSVILMLASKQAFFDGWFFRTYDMWFGITHAAIITPSVLYLGAHLKVG